MPEQQTLKRARKAKREGKAPTTQAGEFVREEIEHVREGKHGAGPRRDVDKRQRVKKIDRRNEKGNERRRASRPEHLSQPDEFGAFDTPVDLHD